MSPSNESPAAESAPAAEPLSPAEKHAVVNATWSEMKKIAPEVSLQFFLNIFEIAPAARELFSFLRDWTEPVSQNARLRAHALLVFTTFGEAASQVGEEGGVEALTPVLQQLGRKHVPRGVQDVHFGVVKAALIKTIEERMPGPELGKVTQAWGEAFDTLAAIMKAEMRSVREAAAAAAAEVQSQPQGEEHSLTPAEKHEIVNSTWTVMKGNAEDLSLNFFLNIFGIAPAAKELFSFLRGWDQPVDQNPRLRAHALLVFTTFGESATQVGQEGGVEALTPVLQNLGRKHVPRGVLDVHFPVVKAALLKTIEEGMPGPDVSKVTKAWGDAFDTLASIMKAEMQRVRVSVEKETTTLPSVTTGTAALSLGQ